MNQTRAKSPTLRFMGRDNSGAAAAKQSCASCGCVSFQNTSSVARYDEDGNCANLAQISCETQWQVRECLKLALCEFLFCIADQYCVNGQFQQPVEMVDDGTGGTVARELDFGDVLKRCLAETLCSVMYCLPNAICGPRQDDCIPPPATLDCNFAVEEKE